MGGSLRSQTCTCWCAMACWRGGQQQQLLHSGLVCCKIADWGTKLLITPYDPAHGSAMPNLILCRSAHTGSGRFKTAVRAGHMHNRTVFNTCAFLSLSSAAEVRQAVPQISGGEEGTAPSAVGQEGEEGTVVPIAPEPAQAAAGASQAARASLVLLTSSQDRCALQG